MIESYDPVLGLSNLLLSLFLIAGVILISWFRRLGLEKEIFVAVFRSVIQLMAVVFVIAIVFELKDIWLIVCVLVLMVFFAGHTSAKRAKFLSHPFMVTFPAIGVGSFSALLVLVVLGVMPVEAEFLIPVGSMTIGGCLVICSLALDRLFRELESHKEEIECALCLGATDPEAAAPYIREGVRASLIPSVDRLKTLGIVILPGAMSGMIIGGVDPLWAAEYQLVIMFLLLASGFLTAVVAAALAERMYFSGVA